MSADDADDADESQLDLDGVLPLWMLEFYHSEPGATNPWFRMVNAIDQKAAVRVGVNLFVADTLNPITIYRILITELLKPEGGEDA